MRGEHRDRLRRREDVLGIIPACAGSTTLTYERDVTIAGSSPHARGARACGSILIPPKVDHPRMRGEHLERGRKAKVADGIIPACAGSTELELNKTGSFTGSSPHARGARDRSCPSNARSWDHPRMRGEHASGRRPSRRDPGIIPACAGSTRGMSADALGQRGSSPHARGARLTSRARSTGTRDHPRMRGEHRHLAERSSLLWRIIPACAGSTVADQHFS